MTVEPRIISTQKAIRQIKLSKDKLFICGGCAPGVDYLMSYFPLSVVISRKRQSLPLCRTAAERIRLLCEIRQLSALRYSSALRRSLP